MAGSVSGVGAVSGGGGGVGAGRGWNAAAAVSAVVICGALGVASYAKLSSPNPAKRFGEDIYQDTVIGVFEIFVIVALLAGHRLRAAWFAVVLMFGGFAGYAGYYMVRGESCGCFGGLIDLPVWGTFAMDLAIVSIALGLLAARRVRVGRLGLVLAGGAVLGVAGWLFAGETRPLTAEEIEERARERAGDAGGAGGEGVGGDGDGVGGSAGGGSIGTNMPRPGEGGGGGGAGVPAESGSGGGDDAPGRADGFTAMERLLRSGMLTEAREGRAGVGWYVFVYDPSCHVCEEKLIDVEAFEQMWAGGHPALRVVKLRKRTVEREAGIEYAAWGGSPVVFVVWEGRVVQVSRDEAAKLPGEVADEIDFEGRPAVNFPDGGADAEAGGGG